MRLKTRIILISILAVLTAGLAGDIIIWNICRTSLIQEAYETSYRETFEEWLALEKKMDTVQAGILDDDTMLYLMKANKNAYLLCTKSETDERQTEIYNQTCIMMQDIIDEFDQSRKQYGVFEYCRFRYEGNRFLIFREIYADKYNLYWIKDISYVQKRLEQLILIMFAISGGLAAVVSLLLQHIIASALKPLHELEKSAQAIAEGDYGKRTEITRKDEIGSLAENFNQMAEAVELRTTQIEESEQRKTLFMGNLTHELKTPLTAISGYADTMLMTKLSAEEEEEALTYICSESKRLERLSRKMMQLLELDERSEIVMETLAVRELFSAVEQACRQILLNKNIRLTVAEQGECVLADSDLMTDVLVNLVDNAVKASKDGSEIILRAGTDDVGNTYLEVEDFGEGIPAEELDRIVEPFYMVDKSRSRKHGGAGLGLALTKLIIDRHGNKLEINSEVGKGTKIRILFV